MIAQNLHDGPNTKSEWAKKLGGPINCMGGPNTKQGGPVPSRPSRSATTESDYIILH